MKIEVKFCFDCPFLQNDIDYVSINSEYCYSCNLLKRNGSSYREYNMGCFGCEENIILEPLKNCPLKTENINVTLLK